VRRRTRAGLLVRALLVTGACAAACREATVTRQEIEEAEASWRRHGVSSYDITVTLSGPFERRVQVAVRDGAVLEATVTEHGLVRPLNEAQARPYTVEGLFRTLTEELRRGGRRFVRVWFDQRYDFPAHSELGPRRDGTDETVLVFRVVDFEALAASEARSAP